MPTRLHTVLKDRGILAAARVLAILADLTSERFWMKCAKQIFRRQPWIFYKGLPGEKSNRLWNKYSTRRMAPNDRFEMTSSIVSFARRHLGRRRFDRPHRAPPLFEVRLSDIRRFRGPIGRTRFRVTPVSRLRMVLVQTGYQRMDPQTGSLVDVGFDWAGRSGTEWNCSGEVSSLILRTLTPGSQVPAGGLGSSGTRAIHS
jgi:hypothetical protein